MQFHSPVPQFHQEPQARNKFHSSEFSVGHKNVFKENSLICPFISCNIYLTEWYMLKLIAICVLFNANYYPKNVLKNSSCRQILPNKHILSSFFEFAFSQNELKVVFDRSFAGINTSKDLCSNTIMIHCLFGTLMGYFLLSRFPPFHPYTRRSIYISHNLCLPNQNPSSSVVYTVHSLIYRDKYQTSYIGLHHPSLKL